MKGWPDWRGRAVAIVASGPSTKGSGVERLQGRVPVLAVKRNVELCPWAEVVYGCDGAWWRSVRGLPDFKGLRLSYDARVCTEYGLTKVEIPDKHRDALLMDTVGVVGSGGNSGFQALNLAAQFGASRIVLVGFDLHDRSGVHWYGRNNAPGMANPGDSNFRRWLTAFAGVAPDLERRGIEVLNASPISDLRCFPKLSIADALTRWGID